MKACELCSCPARMYCEADRASLCWECDEKVHSVNFLVAKHSRTLLCHVCQSPTPWKASGPKLVSTVSVCEMCVNNCSARVEVGSDGDEQSRGWNGNDEDEDEFEDENNDTDDDDDDSGGDDGEYTNSDDEDDCGDGDNQVVPRSLTPPPPVETSSSEDVFASTAGGEGVSDLKRTREIPDLHYEVEVGSYFGQSNHKVILLAAMSYGESEKEEDTSSSLSSSRQLKMRRTKGNNSTRGI